MGGCKRPILGGNIGGREGTLVGCGIQQIWEETLVGAGIQQCLGRNIPGRISAPELSLSRSLLREHWWEGPLSHPLGGRWNQTMSHPLVSSPVLVPVFFCVSVPGRRVQANNFGRKHWWEVESIQFWEGTLVAGGIKQFLGGNIVGRM